MEEQTHRPLQNPPQARRRRHGHRYEAEDTRLARRVALKFLPEDKLQDSESPSASYDDARAASALNHPAICTIYAIEEHER